MLLCSGGGMADADDSKSSDRKVMWVRLPPRAPNKNGGLYAAINTTGADDLRLAPSPLRYAYLRHNW